MAKVGGPIVPITLNDGTEIHISIDEGREIYEGLKPLYAPLELKPMSAASIVDPTANPQITQNEPG